MDEETIKETMTRVWDESVKFYAELDGESDRAAAILAAANFEDKLCETIIEKFVKLNRENRKKLFKGYGPLSTFAAKIDIAFALGLYDQETQRGLHIIRKIRNIFAHASSPIEFDCDDIVKICEELKLETSLNSDNLRYRYVSFLKEVETKLSKKNLSLNS